MVYGCPVVNYPSNLNWPSNMAGLSSNVLNMKFMQKAQAKKDKQAEEEVIKKVKDSSEWVLPNKTSVERNLKPAMKVQTVGYGSIASLTRDDVAEKKQPEAELQTETKESRNLSEPDTNDKVKDEASKFLKSILKSKEKNSKKRRSSGPAGLRKRRG